MNGPLFDGVAGIYDWLTTQSTWQSSVDALSARVPAGARSLVDLGCGPGGSTLALARRHPGAQVAGLDLSRRMLARARRRAGDAPVTFVRADALHLPFKSASVDALVGHSFLYLLPDRDRALAECLRVLRPGGRLLLMEPRRGPLGLREVLRQGQSARYLLSVAFWRPVGRLYGQFTPESLRALLESARFTRCEVEPHLGGLALIARADRP